jgi:hypothetical protein
MGLGFVKVNQKSQPEMSFLSNAHSAWWSSKARASAAKVPILAGSKMLTLTLQ